jgi:CheY-like chemotaxis protein
MKRIIIVDDDPGVQSAFSLIFDPELYEVVVYSNGNELLNNQFETPDLFILDKHIPVLIISASPNIANLAVQAGADGFIEKPFSIMEIREMVMKFVM